MLNIDVNRSADGAERYFDRELPVSDYLMKEPGVRAGRGAERLGLRGPVQRLQFVALLRNQNPGTGKRPHVFCKTISSGGVLALPGKFRRPLDRVLQRYRCIASPASWRRLLEGCAPAPARGSWQCHRPWLSLQLCLLSGFGGRNRARVFVLAFAPSKRLQIGRRS